ncbi:hypothetical protein [Streptomyces sp. NPDC102437]|uniref:hypothetical protein n=1 Tax=Streptomyces sp. NPDC102437 TaxID=3366175 RepID=UPI003817BE2E
MHRAAGSAVLVHDTRADRLRIGWTLPHGGWRQVARRGIDGIRAELARALPPFEGLLHDQIRSMSDLTLLDVFAAHSRE